MKMIISLFEPKRRPPAIVVVSLQEFITYQIDVLLIQLDGVTE